MRSAQFFNIIKQEEHEPTLGYRNKEFYSNERLSLAPEEEVCALAVIGLLAIGAAAGNFLSSNLGSPAIAQT